MFNRFGGLFQEWHRFGENAKQWKSPRLSLQTFETCLPPSSANAESKSERFPLGVLGASRPNLNPSSCWGQGRSRVLRTVCPSGVRSPATGRAAPFEDVAADLQISADRNPERTFVWQHENQPLVAPWTGESKSWLRIQ